MKKILALLLVAMMAATLFAACGGGASNAGGDDAALVDKGVAVTPAGELPIVNEPVELNILVIKHDYVEDYDTNKFTLYIEESTGVDLTFQTIPSLDANQKVNLLLASNTDLPDVFMTGTALTGDMVVDMADQGIFIPLDDLVEKYGYWYKEVLEKDPLVGQIVITPDGKQYTMPKVIKSVPNSTSARGWINNNWLETLGLATPTTTDEFADVLRAFKTGDPNGNGQADEIPFIGATVSGWHSNPYEFIINAFVQYNRDYPIYIDDDGKVQASFDKPEYREGLKYLNMLVNEGLLDPATFTQDEAQLKQIFANEDAALVGFVPGGGTFQYDSMDGERVREYGPLSPLKGPEGVQYSWYSPYNSYSVTEWAITNACENPAVAFRVSDFMYSRESSMRNRLGEPNVDYTIPTGGEMGVDGDPATYIPVLLWGEIQNSHWNEIGTTYNDFDNNCVKVDNPYELQQYLWNATADYYTPYVPSTDRCYNGLTFYTVEDARAISDVWSVLRDYERGAAAQFVTGVLDPNDDAAWNQFLSEVEGMGYKDWLEIIQKRLDQ
jgi:putative aldouronate transport system substrate-binding protein